MTALFQMHSSQEATGLSAASTITNTPVFPKMETILLFSFKSKAFAGRNFYNDRQASSIML